MGLAMLLLRVLGRVISKAHMVGDELDEATRDRMRRRSEMLSKEMARMLQELEQAEEMKRIEQNGVTWSGLLSAALWNWKFWVIAILLLLLIVGLCCCFSKISPEVSSSSSSKEEEDTEEKEEGTEEEEEDTEEEEEDPEKEEEDTEEEEEDTEEEDASEAAIFSMYIAKRNVWSPNKLWNRSKWVHAVVESLVTACQESNSLSKRFLPELGPAMGVGSAFDCWSPQEDDPVYRMLVILKPPHGHTFCLEPGTVENESRICVQLKCTCTAQQMVGPMPCFFYSPEEQLTEEQKPSLLHTLCTGSYLDVQKIACWFQDLVRENKASTPLLPSCDYSLAVLPSRRSCRVAIQRTCGRTTLVEMIFGVQLGNSDIFMSSQEREGIFSPSTTWTLTCAQAEAKFLWLMFGQTPDDSLHSLLHLCTRMLAGRGFFTYALKTVVMHLLTTTPLSGWQRKEFLQRLDDIMTYLNRCLEEKRLDHFFFGNRKIPEEIVLPPFLERAKPFNLFQHLAQDPAAHERAMREFEELQHWLTAQLLL